MAFYRLHNYVIPIVNISFVYLIILRLTNHQFVDHFHLPQSLGFNSEDQLSIQKLLGAILHLGNIKMEDAGDGESSRVGSMIVAARAASLLGTTKTALAKALTTRLVAAKGDLVEANLNPARATYGRDALAKVTSSFKCM